MNPDGVSVLVPETALREQLEPVPASVELVPVPEAGSLPDRAHRAELLVVSHELSPRLPELVRLPALHVVQTLSAGVDWLLPLVPDGLRVCNASGVHDGPVSEWVAAVVLAMERRLRAFWELQREGRWDEDVNSATATGPSAVGRIDDLEGKLVLVLGHGSIGRALEARLRPFGVRVVGVARHARPGVRTLDELPALLPLADVVVLLLPLTPESEGLVDERFLARMQDGALLVNAARGAIVDTEALERELRAGRLRAALDVTDPEPLPPGHSLWTAPNVLVTPHVAGSTTRWLERAYRFVGDQLRRYAAGEPLANVRSDY